jgi:hypothetical protein
MIDFGTILSRWAVRNLGAADYGTNVLHIDETVSVGFTNGAGANQASTLYAKTRSVNASANDDIDLSGVLSDSLGGTITPTKVKGIRIRANAANPGDLLIGPAPANGFISPFNAAADRIRCAPGGYVDLINPTAAGWTVTPGTGDLLRVTNGSGGGTATYQIEVLAA